MMKKYFCTACDYVYDPEKGDPENGIAAGTPFDALPDEWVCPWCGLARRSSSPSKSKLMAVLCSRRPFVYSE